MEMVGRRRFLKTLAGGVTAASLGPGLLVQGSPDAVLTLSLAEKGAVVPTNFTGLSYESSQLAHPEFFSAANHALVEFFRTLGSAGVLRIGGNMSEFTVWSQKNVDAAVAGEVEGPDPGNGSDRTYTITPRAIDNLAGFLEATGWQLIYGLNLARGDAQKAADEAAYVVGKMGMKLLALQFGNEPDLFKHDGDKTKHWTYDEYIAKWLEFKQAVRVRIPGVPLAGPDTSYKPDWVKRFAADTKGDAALLTTHYYAEGPPADPRMTIDYLLRPGMQFQSHVLDAVAFARQAGLPYRMSEGNTCYNAGKRGVSDTFASALWVADFMLAVAQAGGTGVNLHGGGDGLYTPIAGAASKGFSARPIYYGMLLAKQFVGAQLVKTQLESNGRNLAAYAATRGVEGLVIAVINRESQSVEVGIKLPDGTRAATGSVSRLTAPSIESTSGVRLGGQEVLPGGALRSLQGERFALRNSSGSVQVPAYSAALVVLPRLGSA